MSDLFGLIYAIGLCGFGGFIAQLIYQFLHPKLGMLWSGGVAAMVAFFIMVMIAVITQVMFDYPPLDAG